jgi:hypothetical protein
MPALALGRHRRDGVHIFPHFCHRVTANSRSCRTFTVRDLSPSNR